MNDQRKTKKQLLEELELERERSIALQEISNRLAGARDTDEELDLIEGPPAAKAKAKAEATCCASAVRSGSLRGWDRAIAEEWVY